MNELFPGLDTERFFEEIFEQRSFPIETRAGLAEDLFTLDDALLALRYSPAQIRVVYNGHQLKASEYRDADGEIDVDRIEDLILSGVSLNLDRAHQYSAHLCWFVGEVERFFKIPVSVNFYYTPPGGRALHAHYDSHDILVAQVSGSKHWKMCERLTEKVPLLELHPHNCAQDDFQRELTLRAGDLFYLPRGLGHVAWCEQESSAHLTVGLHPENAFRVLEKMLHRVASEQTEFGRSIPAQMLESLDFDAIDQRLAELTEKLIQAEPPNPLELPPRPPAPLPRAVEGSLKLPSRLHYSVEENGLKLGRLSLKRSTEPLLRRLQAGHTEGLEDFCYYLYRNGIATVET